MIFEFLLVTVFELVYMALKTINITKIVENKAGEAAMLGGFMTILWLASTAIGISSILDGEFLIAVGYVIGSMAGCYIGVKFKTYGKRKEEEQSN